jgi:hypothetical protein
MTLHAAWTITGTVDDIYRPGAITAAADDSLEQLAARLQDKDISALVILDGYGWPGSSPSATSSVPWPTGATWPTAPPAST